MSSKKPSASGAGKVGADILYSFGRSSLGMVLAARSPRGVCAILLGDDARELVAELRAQFPSAREAKGDTETDSAVAAVVELAEQPWRTADFPLDVGGTEFQRRVWREVCAVEPGSTESYAGIARRIGAPKALRAVAGACAANVLALAIPCHRVLRSNGSLSGYRWGLERKRLLLEREREAVSESVAREPV
jgi:AraC family transcriptional regulator of adaptative response/methylated-DNA-[protein]-cysteine methyltransferase